jgi:ABC-type dipeptide/oligopeptide/nickel transport system permease component
VVLAACIGGGVFFGVMAIPLSPDDFWIANEGGLLRVPPQALQTLPHDLAATLSLSALALLQGIVLSLSFLFLYFTRTHQTVLKTLAVFPLICVSIPAMWWATWLWTPESGIFLPSLALSIPYASFWTGWWIREWRDKVYAPQLGGPAQWARAHGFSKYQIFWNVAFMPHARRFFGQWIANSSYLIAGSTVVEVSFQRPGLGLRLVDTFHQRQSELLLPTLGCVLALSLATSIIGRGLADAPFFSRDEPFV